LKKKIESKNKSSLQGGKIAGNTINILFGFFGRSNRKKREQTCVYSLQTPEFQKQSEQKCLENCSNLF
jgi:hypothetical protein